MDAAKARQFYEDCLNTLYIQRNLGRLGDFFAANIISHPTFPGQVPGIQGFELITRAFLDTFSDISLRIESFSQEGDTFSCHLVMKATHVGNFMGIPATGRKVEVVDNLRYRLENGRIVEYWSNVDTQALQHQLSAA
ncbi:ester cyclase [Archangium lipolyticum]|uniref:ester cyclase n=1 Tax=Archangium lipolyticum TaxID=2970465 RepID=UPI00214A837F|nr:ester cyclase [Archangium lipolyticum]